MCLYIGRIANKLLPAFDVYSARRSNRDGLTPRGSFHRFEVQLTTGRVGPGRVSGAALPCLGPSSESRTLETTSPAPATLVCLVLFCNTVTGRPVQSFTSSVHLLLGLSRVSHGGYVNTRLKSIKVAIARYEDSIECLSLIHI